MSTVKKVLDVHEKPQPAQWVTLSIQHLFAMFGATVLVPLLVGLEPGIALITSGLGTLAYIFITKGNIPVYLGSSFAFIAALTSLRAKGIEDAMMAVFIVGVMYALVALVVKLVGYKAMLRFLPPVVIGPIVMVIGLGLAATAVGMSMYSNFGAPATELHYSTKHLVVALITLGITVIAANFIKGFFGLIPVLIGIVGGYITAVIAGLVDFSGVKQASWFAVPDFSIPFVSYTPQLSWAAIAIIPIVIVPIAEHIGNVMLLGKIADKNFVQKPGLDRSIFGDGVSIIIASIFGGVPNTTYGENIGVMALTKIFSVYVIGGAAVFAILFGFIGKFSALISSIPSPVMGGVSILLFGIIASGGLRMLIENKVDLSINRNLIIVATILIIGVGGLILKFTDNFSLSGMALAAIIGVILNLVLPNREAGFGTNQEHL